VDKSSSSTILVVDDEPAVREALEDLLVGEGYRVHLAESGAEALPKATKIVPDLILLDVMMPDVDGLTVCRDLRADALLAEVPIILITSLADRASRLQGFEAGADDYVTKPFDEAELLARVRTTTRLNRYRRLIEEQARRRQAEVELRESEGRLRALVESASEHIFMLDRNGICLSSNDRVDHLGLEAGTALVGRHLRDIYPPEVAEIYQRQFDQVLDAGQAVDFEHTLLEPAGERYHLDTLYPILRDGEVWAVGGICRDITDRKRAEEALRLSLQKTASSQRLLLALSHAAQAVQRARTLEEVYHTIGEQILKLGYHSAIFTLTEDKKHLAASYLTLDSSLLKAAEELAGISRHNYRFALEAGGFYDRILTKGETVFGDPGTGPIAEALPKPLRPLAGKLADLLGVHRAIYAPLEIGGEVQGLLTLMGPDLTDDDVPGMTAFASQAAIAVENAQHFQAARQQRDRAQRYLDVAGVILVALNSAGEITLINRKGCDIIGCDENAVLGKNWFDTCLPVEIRKSVKSVFDQLMSGAIAPVEYFENPVLTKSGEERLIAWYNTVLKDAKGGIVGTLSSGEDITERVRSEEERARAVDALRESEEKHRSVVDNANVGIVVIQDGRRVFHNARVPAILGYSEEEYRQIDFVQTIHPDDRQLAIDRIRERLGGEEAASEGLEIRLVTKPGETRWVQANSSTIRWDGKPALQAFIADITDRKRAEEALQRRNRELAALNQASHAISSFLDLDQILTTLLEEVRRVMDVAAASVWLLDPETRDLVCRQATGPRNDIVQGWRLMPGEGLAGWVAHSGESLIVPDIRADERHYKRVDRATGLNLRSLLSVPLRVKKEVVGVLQVVDETVERFDEADLELLEPLAAAAAVAIDNARLYEEANRLRVFSDNIVQSLEEGILLEDATGQFAFANPKAAALLGYAADELVGRRWADILAPGYKTEIEEGDRKVGEAAVRYETALLTGEGLQMPVIVSSRSLYREGRFIGVLSAFTDITARIRAMEEIRRRNEELSVLNAIAATVSESLNLEQLLGDALDEVVRLDLLKATGKGAIFLLNEQTGELSMVAQRGFPETQPCLIHSLQLGECLCGQAAQQGKLIIEDSSQDKHHSLQWPGMSPHKDICLPIKARDRVLGVMALELPVGQEVAEGDVRLLTAISDQIGTAIENARLVEEAAEVEILQELNRLRSELIANVSHELRTPLGLIKIFCSTLLADDVEFDDETQQECLRNIDEEADRLASIVDNLLDLSRIESERLAMDARPADIGELAQGVMHDMEAQTTHHRFVHDFPDQPLAATVDAQRIEQVLRNLLTNAVKYSPDGGTITIRGRGDQRQLYVGVSDEGIGIPHHDLERVFERFYRVENEVTQRVGGAGLGLAVCRGIVEAHGGRIWVESTPGAGSTVYFTLVRDPKATLEKGEYEQG
jgi:two-component system sensor histidine kinase KdpD